MARTRTYDFKKSNIIFGISQITGFADGDAVEIAEANDAFKSEGGADGFVDRVKNANNFLNIKIKLRQTSPANQVLSAIHTADRLAGTPLPFSFTDTQSGDIFTAVEAWIVKFPDIKRGNNVVEHEWMIHTGSDYVSNIGGF
jgi:hypothetical protein